MRWIIIVRDFYRFLLYQAADCFLSYRGSHFQSMEVEGDLEYSKTYSLGNGGKTSIVGLRY
jgi:hypothetical protein